mmetsp:Transcript_67163/g.165750  ORF Transcript_67163/g.165750 Transcript_67163/m.165750 type:complete len:389 (-) Transcript_67163:583-1749(-)
MVTSGASWGRKLLVTSRENENSWPEATVEESTLSTSCPSAHARHGASERPSPALTEPVLMVKSSLGTEAIVRPVSVIWVSSSKSKLAMSVTVMVLSDSVKGVVCSISSPSAPSSTATMSFSALAPSGTPKAGSSGWVIGVGATTTSSLTPLATVAEASTLAWSCGAGPFVTSKENLKSASVAIVHSVTVSTSVPSLVHVAVNCTPGVPETMGNSPGESCVEVPVRPVRVRVSPRARSTLMDMVTLMVLAAFVKGVDCPMSGSPEGPDRRAATSSRGSAPFSTPMASVPGLVSSASGTATLSRAPLSMDPLTCTVRASCASGPLTRSKEKEKFSPASTLDSVTVRTSSPPLQAGGPKDSPGVSGTTENPGPGAAPVSPVSVTVEPTLRS